MIILIHILFNWNDLYKKLVYQSKILNKYKMLFLVNLKRHILNSKFYTYIS